MYTSREQIRLNIYKSIGKKRIYDLGLMLKDRYNQLLKPLYYPPMVYVRSTMIPRTKISAQICHAALFQIDDQFEKWNHPFSWHPADINYIHDAQDMLLFPILCPVYYRLYQKMLQTPEIKAKIAEFDDLREKLSICTRKNITSMYDFFHLYNTMFTQRHYGLPLLQCTQNIFLNGTIVEAAIFQLKLFSYGPLNKLNGGILLGRIINDMKQKINGTLPDRKINLFSAHDINVAALLQALNIYNNEIPRYGSCIMIELHEKYDEFFVKVLYYLGIPAKTEEKIIPGCEVLCPYNKFVQLLSATTATNEESQCPEKMNLNFKF
ncbi:venom acid phosphatase Acph-1-like isoform X2 [Nylanderia fulva]|uniref:venom acid phosphatase Acph-1-like isoform X2 n=1 Tax=Nylanderia fulva TaxID=613905 RepID=UPI0010FB6DED|nr:venom acid phosphatase Acph-1-like isoform X2 [Nylanderia fulva]